ncbi:unnamed protein product [Macrosiphum euphorbiae]|uniref:Secreted protein n=1 Tax=Macrosiphum euphorbiae TaxID=13131 RepID=A0AAV0WSM8_9HEMI|nr:unnamed protein product [Macrosiphum euphorbiae]
MVYMCNLLLLFFVSAQGISNEYTGSIQRPHHNVDLKKNHIKIAAHQWIYIQITMTNWKCPLSIRASTSLMKRSPYSMILFSISSAKPFNSIISNDRTSSAGESQLAAEDH